VSGKLYFVIGPSGSGKDSLIGYAKSYLGREDGVVFSRRYITRPPDGRCEQHVPVSKQEFLQRSERGEFLICWQAHSYHYAIDHAVIDEMRAGYNVVVNGSRAALAEARKRIPNLVPIVITARIKRGKLLDSQPVHDAIYFRNDGDIKEVGRQFCALLQRECAATG